MHAGGAGAGLAASAAQTLTFTPSQGSDCDSRVPPWPAMEASFASCGPLRPAEKSFRWKWVLRRGRLHSTVAASTLFMETSGDQYLRVLGSVLRRKALFQRLLQLNPGAVSWAMWPAGWDSEGGVASIHERMLTCCRAERNHGPLTILCLHVLWGWAGAEERLLSASIKHHGSWGSPS